MAKKKKYQTKHSLVKKHIPKGFQEIADRIIDHMGQTIDNSTLKDAAFMGAWIAGSYLFYNTFDIIGAKSDAARQAIFEALQMIPILKLLPPPVAPGESTIGQLTPELRIALSLFMSYKILTTDLDLPALTALL